MYIYIDIVGQSNFPQKIKQNRKRTLLFYTAVSFFFPPQVPGKAMLWEKATAYISFVNPLPVALKGGVFTVEGAGLLSATHVYVK